MITNSDLDLIARDRAGDLLRGAPDPVARPAADDAEGEPVPEA